MAKERLVLTISQLNLYIKSRFEEDELLDGLYVRGEISNFTNHLKTGHLFMTLKDSKSAVKAVMFRSSAERLKFVPQNGMKVIARGRVTVFERDGNYQLYLDSIEPDGVGALHMAFEQLKEKLFSEGLFDQDRKRPLPSFPSNIGIVTSPTGAALRDMLSILSRRFPLAGVVLSPAMVQGEGAPGQISAAIHLLNRQALCDVIIIGRGGGSIEDLWAFNDEGVARVISGSKIPVVSAVGHETDFTIADFVADLRAPTPSAAAELITPSGQELSLRLKKLQRRMAQLLLVKIERKRAGLNTLLQKRVLSSPKAYLEDRSIALIYLEKNLLRAYERSLSQKAGAFLGLASKLDALSPLAVLGRGYSIAYDENGKIVKSVSSINCGEGLKIYFKDGTANCKVEELDTHH